MEAIVATQRFRAANTLRGKRLRIERQMLFISEVKEGQQQRGNWFGNQSSEAISGQAGMSVGVEQIACADQEYREVMTRLMIGGDSLYLIFREPDKGKLPL